MHRIKTVLIVLAIMLIALTSLQGIVIAAQVQKVHKTSESKAMAGSIKKRPFK